MKPRERFKRLLIGKYPKRTLARTVIIAGLLFFTSRFILIPVSIKGKSMEPTYNSGAFTFINRLSYLFKQPERGDIVAIRFSGGSVMLLKRILAVPGETMEFQDGTLYVNGKAVEEPYVVRQGSWTRPADRAREDEYFVAGDNRSMDIRYHSQGFVDEARIMGRPLF